MNEFVKLYDWIADTGLTLEERVVFAIINQFSECDGTGFWAGYRTMSARTGIPKLQCKRISEYLVQIQAVEKFNQTIFGKRRVVLKAKKEFVDEFRD